MTCSGMVLCLANGLDRLSHKAEAPDSHLRVLAGDQLLRTLRYPSGLLRPSRSYKAEAIACCQLYRAPQLVGRLSALAGVC